MKVLYLDQVGGISGDMFLAALIDLGVDLAALQAAVRGLGLPDVCLTTRAVTRAGLDALHLEVSWPDKQAAHEILPEAGVPPDGSQERHHHHHHDHHAHPHHHHHEGAEGGAPDPAGGGPESSGRTPVEAHTHRGYTEIARMIRASSLPPRVQESALRVFRRLGEAEAHVHGIALDDVHFHEVGAVDSIADIVGVCWALETLGVDRLHSSAFVLGRGTVAMAHGRWPVPAPATLRLTEGFSIEMLPEQGETVTPTGAALVTALASSVGEPVRMTLDRIGVGAGRRDPEGRPNVLRALLGRGPDAGESVEVLETAMDDLTPQRLARLAALLLDAGALDVWTTPTVMKKGRSGHQLTVLALPGAGRALEDLIFSESTTLGIRKRIEGRRTLPRRFGWVETPWGRIRVKVAEIPGGATRVSPEFDDCQRLALDTRVPFEEIVESARRGSVHFSEDRPGS